MKVSSGYEYSFLFCGLTVIRNGTSLVLSSSGAANVIRSLAFYSSLTTGSLARPSETVHNTDKGIMGEYVREPLHFRRVAQLMVKRLTAAR